MFESDSLGLISLFSELEEAIFAWYPNQQNHLSVRKPYFASRSREYYLADSVLNIHLLKDRFGISLNGPAMLSKKTLIS